VIGAKPTLPLTVLPAAPGVMLDGVAPSNADAAFGEMNAMGGALGFCAAFTVRRPA
jgi:hypothetical protein